MNDVRIPDALVRYFAIREQERHAAAQQLLDGLTPREVWLVHNAAVMGWVLGARSVPGGWQEQVPRDPKIVESVVYSVVEHCQSTSDLYLVIGENLRELIRYTVRKNDGASVFDVARCVAELLRYDHDRVEQAIRDLIDDEELRQDDTGGLHPHFPADDE